MKSTRKLTETPPENLPKLSENFIFLQLQENYIYYLNVRSVMLDQRQASCV